MKNETVILNSATVATGASNREVKLQRAVVDLVRREVRYPEGGSAVLSEKENDLLCYLAGNAGRVISRDEILSQVWRLDPRNIITRVIDMHVVHLRGKLRDQNKPRALRTVHGQGYMFVAA